MSKSICGVFLICSFLSSLPIFGGIKVVTTTTNLKNIVEEVGKNKVNVLSIAKGSQDVHYIEAKPSYMIKLAKAKLLISIGFDLEAAWLPLLMRGARNPSIQKGSQGYLEVAPLVGHPLEKPTGDITRADGDVHPHGNPHVLLSPLNVAKVAIEIANKLGALDQENKSFYLNNAKSYSDRMNQKFLVWKDRIQKSKIKKIVSYHRTLSYFYDAFDIKLEKVLEPKPGVPPTGKHIVEVIKYINRENIKLIFVENYFDPTIANRVVKDEKNTKVVVVPAAVGGIEKVNNLFDLFEHLVTSIEGRSSLGS